MSDVAERVKKIVVENLGVEAEKVVETASFTRAAETLRLPRSSVSAAVIELFRNGSGITVADDFLAESVPRTSKAEVDSAIGDLLEWAILIRQPRLGGYALFAGSDFDLEEAIARSSAAAPSRSRRAACAV